MSNYPNSPTPGAGGYATHTSADNHGGESVGRPLGGGDVGGEHDHGHGARGGCAPIPEFKRLNYFYGQMLGANDFRAEQDYFREKMKLHNRCLHGYGVVCGLKVVPQPIDEKCAPEDDKRVRELYEGLAAAKRNLAGLLAEGAAQDSESVRALREKIEDYERKLEGIRTEECEDEPATTVVVECGLALDCDGNEIVVRRPISIDLWRELNRADRDRVRDAAKGSDAKQANPNERDAGKESAAKDYAPDQDEAQSKSYGQNVDVSEEGSDYKGRPLGGGSTLYLSICFCEQQTDPVRPVMPEACGQPAACTYGKTRDSVKIRVTTNAPHPDKRCEACCEACEDNCLLLARIDNFRPGRALSPEDIHNEVRRPVSLYQMTTITGISWTDGAEYTEAEAEALMGVTPRNNPNPPKGHLLVTFSDEVLVSSLRRGVITALVMQGGGGRSGDVFNIDVQYVDLPSTKTTDRVRFRVVTDEGPTSGDRVMITIHGSRILDECCRPVDAANTGGRTPFVPDEEFKEFRRESPVTECKYPPPFGYGPWASGTNAAGADFVSWFYIKD
jgi:hypothetical protein